MIIRASKKEERGRTRKARAGAGWAKSRGEREGEYGGKLEKIWAGAEGKDGLHWCQRVGLEDEQAVVWVERQTGAGLTWGSKRHAGRTMAVFKSGS